MTRTREVDAGTVREAVSLLLRFASVFTSAVASALSVRVFLTEFAGLAPALFVLSSSAAFLPLAQLGYSRPIYFELLSRHHRASLTRRDVDEVFRFVGLQWLAAITLLALAGKLVSVVYGVPSASTSLIVFSVGLSACLAAAFQRDLMYALLLERAYEACELLRKLSLVAGLWALSVGGPMWVFAIVLIPIALLTQLLLYRKARRVAHFDSDSPGASGGSGSRVIDDLVRNRARHALAFGVAELGIYNMPTIFLLFQSSPTAAVFFGVWQKIFQLLVLPMRLIWDARLNRVVLLIIGGSKAMAREVIRRSLFMSLMALLIPFGVFIVFGHVVGGLLKAEEIVMGAWFLVSVAVWALGNWLVHGFGGIVISYGDGFAAAKRYALLTCLCLLPVYLFGLATGLHMGQTMLVAGVVYALSAVLYFRKLVMVLTLNCVAGVDSK